MRGALCPAARDVGPPSDAGFLAEVHTGCHGSTDVPLRGERLEPVTWRRAVGAGVSTAGGSGQCLEEGGEFLGPNPEGHAQ